MRRMAWLPLLCRRALVLQQSTMWWRRVWQTRLATGSVSNAKAKDAWLSVGGGDRQTDSRTDRQEPNAGSQSSQDPPTSLAAATCRLPTEEQDHERQDV